MQRFHHLTSRQSGLCHGVVCSIAIGLAQAVGTNMLFNAALFGRLVQDPPHLGFIQRLRHSLGAAHTLEQWPARLQHIHGSAPHLFNQGGNRACCQRGNQVIGALAGLFIDDNYAVARAVVLTIPHIIHGKA